MPDNPPTPPPQQKHGRPRTPSLSHAGLATLKALLSPENAAGIRLGAAQTIAKIEAEKQREKRAKKAGSEAAKRPRITQEWLDEQNAKLERARAQVLGIDPDCPRLNQQTGQFEGGDPAQRAALNEQRQRLLKEHPELNRSQENKP